VTEIEYPHITEKIVLDDKSEEAQKIRTGWRFECDWKTKKVTLIGPPLKTADELEHEEIEVKISKTTPTTTDIQDALKYILKKIN